MSTEPGGGTVIVTGAASGIGLGVAEALARCGARVIGWDVDADVVPAMTALGGMGEVLDVSDRGAVEDAAGRLEAEDPPVSGLANCAGIVRRSAFEKMPPEEFELLWRVNVLGTLLPSQAVARTMIARRRSGAIVNIASVAAEHVGAMSAGYAATKGAVVSLTRGAAVSLAPRGIRVNAVMPGPVDTPMNADVHDAPEARRRMLARVPLSRAGRVADVAEAVVFLLSHRAAWVTGETMHVDGGVSVLR